MIPSPDTRPRRERNKLETHVRLLREARRLLAAQGYFATSVEQIAEAAGVASATVFNYFPTKDALIADLAKDLFEGLRDLLDRESEPGATTQSRLAGAFRDATPLLHAARESLGPLLLRVLRRPEPRADRDGHEILRSALSRMFVAGQQRGDVRLDVEASFLAELASAQLFASLGHWLHDPRYPLDARMCQTAAVLGDGLRVPDTSNPSRRDP